MKWHGEVMHAPRFVDTQFGDLALWVSEFDESELEDQMDDHFDAEARRREWQDAQGRGPYANDVSPLRWIFYAAAGTLGGVSIVLAMYMAITMGLIR
jgi:hypothetical protein